jgi:uncharacterized membrane-anchored protein YhcB (DUF1043 family)
MKKLLTMKNLLIVAGALLVLVFVALGIVIAQLNSYHTQIQSTKAELEHTQTELQSTQSSVESLQSQLNSTTDELNFTKQELATDEKTLQLYKDTYGEVYSDIQPHCLKPGLFKDMPIPIKLTNNNVSHNPTWEELKSFLLSDETDTYTYHLPVYDVQVPWFYVGDIPYVCANFAETVHNNAEKAGIRAAFVVVSFSEGEDHALNAFKTTDRGLVFIDCTGSEPATLKPKNLDSEVDLKLGKPYHRCFISTVGWYFQPTEETVTGIEVYW